MVRGKPVRVGAAALAGSLAPGGRRRAGTVNPSGTAAPGGAALLRCSGLCLL